MADNTFDPERSVKTLDYLSAAVFLPQITDDYGLRVGFPKRVFKYSAYSASDAPAVIMDARTLCVVHTKVKCGTGDLVDAIHKGHLLVFDIFEPGMFTCETCALMSTLSPAAFTR